MKRRAFIAGALATGGTLLAGTNAGGASQGAGTAQEKPVEFYELRRYHMRRGPSTLVVDTYLRQALLPALQRAGAGPVGVFSVMIGADSPSYYVLTVHKSLEAYGALPGRLASDVDYQKTAAAYLDVAATSPAYVRIESSLMRAFDAMPKLELPFGGGEAGRRSRIFEIRIYESHSEKAARKKIEMFSIGEIAIFRKAGLQPVFFGETLVGARLPNLTYMLVYEDMAARDKQWAAFAGDPDWKKLSTTPGFTDPEIVANISNVYLRPTQYSQI